MKETPQSLILLPRGCPIQNKAFSTSPPIFPGFIPFATFTISSSAGCLLSRPTWLVRAVINPSSNSSP